jgi:hypothetical protein
LSSKRNKRHNLPTDLISPSSEREQHGLVEQTEIAMVDGYGRLSQHKPYKSVDILVRMERRGSITAAMRYAGENFRNAFRRANLDPLGAIDLSRPFIDKDSRMMSGRSRSDSNIVWRAILVVGGLGSPCGSCLWHVIGFEKALKEWALQQGWNGRRVSQEAAYGILIGALGALESYYRREGK